MYNKMLGKIGSSMLAFSMIVSVFPNLIGQTKVSADYVKTADNTRLGISGIQTPYMAVEDTYDWAGSYVYYGSYDNEPIKFRVLAPSTTVFGTNTLFLDSDKVLFKAAFDTKNVKNWETSSLKALLNSSFLNDSFTDIEKNAIANSYRESHDYVAGTQAGCVSSYIKSDCKVYTALKGEKVFLLDVEDVSDISYGLNVTYRSCVSRRKKGAYSMYLLRSVNLAGNGGYSITDYGNFANTVLNSPIGVAPALNIKHSSILFSSLVGGGTYTSHGQYKLTILDPQLSIALPSSGQTTITDNKVSVPYVITGQNATNANRVSYLITDKPYTDSNAKILYYGSLADGLSSTIGRARFSLPSGCDINKWGSGYYVYIVAECVNGQYETDYASQPVPINAPVSVPQVNVTGISLDETSVSLIEGLSPIQIHASVYPVDATDGSVEWSSSDDSIAKVSRTGIVTPIKAGTVTITATATNGTEESSDDKTARCKVDVAEYTNSLTFDLRKEIIVNTVQRTYLNEIISQGLADISYDSSDYNLIYLDLDKDGIKDVSFNTLSRCLKTTGNKITGKYVVNYPSTFNGIDKVIFVMSNYKIAIDPVVHGSASAIPTGAIGGEKVNIAVTPDQDYELDKITYTPQGGSSIDITSSKSFVMPDKNVKVNVSFKRIEHKITLTGDENVVAVASPARGTNGTKVTISAFLKKGYKFKEWQVLSGDVKLADPKEDTTTFTIGIKDVKIKAISEKTDPSATDVTPTPASKPVTVTPKPTAKSGSSDSVVLTLDKNSANVVCGETTSLKAALKGSSSKITWKSSDSSVATVDANGKVTAKMAGAVTITATAAGKSASCKITVLYKDVTNTKDFWYAPTNYLTEAGVVKGYDKQTRFKPANECTRAQMVTFIWRLQGEPAPKTKTCKFKDVKSSDYYYKACIWGTENHIVEGYKDGTFGPKIVCARKHAVTFLWRLAGQPKPSSSKNKFKDVKEKDYYYKACLWASEKGILAGYSDGTFRPDGNCLRRQMVTFLYKYDKFVNGKG